MKSTLRFFTPLFALGLLSACATTAANSRSSQQRTLERSEAVTANTRLTLENLVGHVELVRGGSRLHILATVVAGGDSQADATALADSIKLSTSRDGDRLLVHVDYPVASHQGYHYMPTGSDGGRMGGIHFLGLHIGGGYSRSSADYQGRRVSVYQGSDHGVPLHVDLKVEVPVGLQVEVDNHVGRIGARDLDGKVVLKTDQGDIAANTLHGELVIHSGSGDTTVNRLQGRLSVDTGSGDIDLNEVTGNADIRTGSGDILANGLHGDALSIKTGSGDIRLNGLAGDINIRSGSGDITLAGVGKAPHARVSCGSGDINLSGDLSGVQNFDLQTGSGDVTVATRQPPAVHLEINSGDITTDWPEIEHGQRSDRHFSGDIGAASGLGRIGTGSGQVDLHG